MTIAAPPLTPAQAYRAAVLASAPQAYWPLDDLVGSATAREVAHNANGLVEGGVTFQVPDPFGAAAAAHFDGSSAYVVDPSGRARVAAVPFTVECWYRTTQAGASLVEFNSTQLAPLGTTYGSALYLNGGQLTGFSFGGPLTVLSEGKLSNDGLWHWCAFVFDGAQGVLYRDGVQVAQMALAMTQGFTAYWHIGLGRRLNTYLLGDMAHVATYTRALGPSELLGHYSAALTAAPTLPARRAWLVLPNGQSILLDNPAGGYFCQSLDLGTPVVRDVVVNRPDQHGTDDRSAYFAGRTVVANITALSTARAQIDAVAAAFAPYMLPGVRPVLHYVLDRPGAPERVLTVRGEAYDFPIVGAVERDITLTWVAPDPVVRDPNVQIATAFSGSSGGGRVYNLTYPRDYPTGGAASGTTITTAGDLPAQPMLHIYGPITTPKVTFLTQLSGQTFQVWGVHGFAIAAGHYVAIDTAARTAYLDGDRTKNLLASIDWLNTSWPMLPPLPDSSTMTIAGDPQGGVMTGVTQVQATWQDGFLT
jgi:hypothetical protein